MIRSHPFTPEFWTWRRAVVLLVFLSFARWDFGTDPASAFGELLGLFILAWVAIVLFNRGRELVGRVRQPQPDSG